jgi:hypothetical protein
MEAEMAFAGLNVTFGSIQMSQAQQVAIAPIYGPASASENMAAGATSAVSCPAGKNGFASMVSVYAAADSWVTIGQGTPADPSAASPTGGKRFIPAATLVDIFCSPGDKVRWSLA